MFVAGLTYFPRLRSAFTIPWPAIVPGEPVERIVIEDVACPRKEYDQELVVVLTTRRLPELVATISLASATAVLIIMGKMSAPPFLIQGWGLLGLEFACLSAWAILLINVQWFSERQFLRSAYWAFSLISTRGSGFPQRETTYQFLDHNGQRIGGRGPLWGHQRDNAAIVFYRPDDPEKNVVHGALLFHKLRIHLIPRNNSGDQTHG